MFVLAVYLLHFPASVCIASYVLMCTSGRHIHRVFWDSSFLLCCWPPMHPQRMLVCVPVVKEVIMTVRVTFREQLHLFGTMPGPIPNSLINLTLRFLRKETKAQRLQALCHTARWRHNHSGPQQLSSKLFAPLIVANCDRLWLESCINISDCLF